MDAASSSTAGSGLAQEAGLQYQVADLVRMTLDVFGVVFHQADVADHRALLERDRRALDLQVLDDDHGVAGLERVAVDVAHHRGLASGGLGVAGGPFVAAVGADEERTVWIGVLEAALRAGGNGGHHGSGSCTGPFIVAAGRRATSA